MPHIHVERRPRHTSALTILLVVIILLILAAVAWYFIAGPGKSAVSSLKTSSIGSDISGPIRTCPPDYFFKTAIRSLMGG